MATGTHSHSTRVTRFTRDIAIAENAGRTGGALIAKRGIAQNEYIQLTEDFFRKPGAAQNLPWTATKTGTSTNNTVDFGADAAAGTYVLTHSADSEAQTMRVDWADQLMINMSKSPRMECRLKLNTAGATFSADQRLVVGFASDYNATLDNVTTNAWFRIEGASLALKVEGDDGTTDTDDQAAGIAYVDDTYLVLEVDIGSDLIARFKVDGATAGSVSLAALAANTVVQPIVAIQRDAGTEQEVVTIDYIDLTWTR